MAGPDIAIRIAMYKGKQS